MFRSYNQETKVRISLVTITAQGRLDAVGILFLMAIATFIAVLVWIAVGYGMIWIGNIFLEPKWPYDFKHVAGVALFFAILHGIFHRD